MGNSPWDCKESDMTDRLTFSLSHLLVFLGPGIWEQLGRAVLTHEGTAIGQRAPPPEGSPGAGGVPSKEAHSHGCEMVRQEPGPLLVGTSVWPWAWQLASPRASSLRDHGRSFSAFL